MTKFRGRALKMLYSPSSVVNITQKLDENGLFDYLKEFKIVQVVHTYDLTPESYSNLNASWFIKLLREDILEGTFFVYAGRLLTVMGPILSTVT